MSGEQRLNGTILAYFEPPDSQQRARKFDVVQGVLEADDTGWIYAWTLGSSYRDGTTPDKLQAGCRVSFYQDQRAPYLCTGISFHLVTK